MEITTEENRISIDGVSYPKNGFYVKPIPKGVALVDMSKSWSIKILVDGTTIDGSPVADRDELMTFFNEQGFKSGGSGPGAEVSWGSIVGNIEDQADLVDYIAENGGGGGSKIPDWEEGSYNKDQTVIIYEGDNAVMYRSLVDDNDSSPLFTNPWEYVGEVSDILNWDSETNYNLGDQVLYSMDGGGESLVVLLESAVDSPSSNPLEGTGTGEWVIKAVLADPVEWNVNTEYSPYGGVYLTVVSSGSSYYSTSVSVIGVNPLSTNQWEKVSNLEFDEKNFRIVDGKVYLGRAHETDGIFLSSTGTVSLSYRDGISNNVISKLTMGPEDSAFTRGRKGILFVDFDGSFKIFDHDDLKGITYLQDYSTNGKLDDRWIPDWGAVKAYVDDNQGTAPTWTTIEGKPDFVAEGADAAAARTALGLGTAATTDSSAYATAAQGALASSAVQPATLDARLSEAQRAAIDLLVSPTTDYADMSEATAAIKSIIDALKAI